MRCAGGTQGVVACLLVRWFLHTAVVCPKALADFVVSGRGAVGARREHVCFGWCVGSCRVRRGVVGCLIAVT